MKSDLRKIVLEDDNSGYGGTAFYGETLGDFLDELDPDDIGKDPNKLTIREINRLLKECGIRSITRRRTRFVTWAKKDPDDERKIHYTFRMKESDGTAHTENFTSDDWFGPENAYSMLERVRNAWIEFIELVDTPSGPEWFVVLYED